LTVIWFSVSSEQYIIWVKKCIPIYRYVVPLSSIIRWPIIQKCCAPDRNFCIKQSDVINHCYKKVFFDCRYLTLNIVWFWTLLKSLAIFSQNNVQNVYTIATAVTIIDRLYILNRALCVNGIFLLRNITFIIIFCQTY